LSGLDGVGRPGAQTIDARIAELIDCKAGIAARALGRADEAVSSSADVQLEALVALLTDALRAPPETRAAARAGF
jgi:4-aminobutyrate aminotransferase-like enzyme